MSLCAMSTSPETTVHTHEPQRPSRHEWGHVDARREHHVDERGLARPTDVMPTPVEFHIGGGFQRVFSYGHSKSV